MSRTKHATPAKVVESKKNSSRVVHEHREHARLLARGIDVRCVEGWDGLDFHEKHIVGGPLAHWKPLVRPENRIKLTDHRNSGSCRKQVTYHNSRNEPYTRFDENIACSCDRWLIVITCEREVDTHKAGHGLVGWSKDGRCGCCGPCNITRNNRAATRAMTHEARFIDWRDELLLDKDEDEYDLD